MYAIQKRLWNRCTRQALQELFDGLMGCMGCMRLELGCLREGRTLSVGCCRVSAEVRRRESREKERA